MEEPTSICSPEEERGLAAILDTLIPPSEDGRLPGAGELGLARYVAERAPELRALIAAGLADLDARAGSRGAATFASLAAAERTELLAAFAAEDALLLPALVFHAYGGYYQQRAVVEALGLEHRPPYPQGFPMEPTDTSRLEGVRRRGRRFRVV